MNLLVETLNSSPKIGGGVGSYCDQLLKQYLAQAPQFDLKLTLSDFWMGESGRCRHFEPLRYLYGDPMSIAGLRIHAVHAFRDILRNSSPLVTRLPGAPLFVTHHDFIDLDFPFLFPKAELELRKDAYRRLPDYQGIVTPSKTVSDRLVGEFKVDPARVTVIPHGNDHVAGASIRPAPDLDRRYLLAIGKDYPHKNWSTLFEAVLANGAALRRHTMRLVVVSADAQALRAKYEQLQAGTKGAADLVEFVDFIEEGGLRRIYEQASGFISPSFAEGFGMPLNEAKAFGLPVCASNLAVYKEVLDGYDALFFDPWSRDDMAYKLGRFVEQAVARVKRSVSLRCWADVAHEHLTFFQHVGA